MAGVGKAGILGQEAVAGMDRIGIRFSGSIQNAVNVEIRSADRNRFVSSA
jgi:hypothetical protein